MRTACIGTPRHIRPLDDRGAAGRDERLLTVEFAIAKTNKYATRDSGDTAELIERPGGGLSVVLVDGQGSGPGAKLLSNALSSKAVALLKEGARDGAVARATHDYLHHYRGGRVSATLDLVSVDLASKTVVISRNSHCPLVLRDGEGPRGLVADAGPIGFHRHTRPHIHELPIAPGLQLVVFTDGVLSAGERRGQPFDAVAHLTTEIDARAPAGSVAESILAAAVRADDGRPNDDMTVVALVIYELEAPAAPLVRRMSASLPLEGLVARRP